MQERDGVRVEARGADGPAIVGVDIGSSSIKAVAFDAGGRKLAAASRPTPMARMATGGEYDADTVFDTALAVLAEVARALAGRPVAGIAATSVGESCVLIDGEGRAVAPAIAWFDRRTMPEAAEIAERLSADRLFQLTGVGPEFSFTLAKLLWMRRHWPDAFARGATRTDDGGLDRVPSLGRRSDRPDARRPHPILRHRAERMVGGAARTRRA